MCKKSEGCKFFIISFPENSYQPFITFYSPSKKIHNLFDTLNFLYTEHKMGNKNVPLS